MPIYEYECMTCGKRQEVLQRHDDTPLTTCANCGGHMKKLMSSTSFVLKGTGWYKNDYASESTKKEKADKTEKTATVEKSGDTSSDKKPAAKTEAKPEPAAKA